MSARDSDSQQYNIMQAQLLALENRITERLNKEAHYQNDVDKLDVRLSETQDTDERKQINDQIQTLRTTISTINKILTTLYDERRQCSEALFNAANRSRQFNKRKRRYPIFFVDSMLYN